MIYIAADHRGFHLKQKIYEHLVNEGMEVTDLGNDHFDQNDDYPDFANRVAEATAGSEENKGILLCGSGAGVDIVANKVPGIRSALVFDKIRAIQAREHENVNVISLPADSLDEEEAWKIVSAFLNTPFSNEERHIRRLEEIQKVEEKYEK